MNNMEWLKSMGADRLAEWICDYAESNKYPSKMDVYLWLRKERNEDENFPINLRYR